GGAGGGRGRGAGRGAWVFPAKPGVPTGWTETPGLLPFSLRGDAEDLPVLRDLTEASRDAFTAACSARELAEERRLAYVAVTRAAYWGACCGYWWGEGASPLGPSLFLEGVRGACAGGGGTVPHWAPPPDEDAQNPALADPPVVSWPEVADTPRQAAVREAATMVERELARLAGEGGAGAGDAADGEDDSGELSEPDQALARAWARDTSLLLAELSQRRGRAPNAVPRPRQPSGAAPAADAPHPAPAAPA